MIVTVTSRKILIVEDEEITAHDLRQQLTKLGYQVGASAASGADALRLCDEFHPDLVLMDVELDGPLDGLETSRMIKTKLNVPVIFLTAFPNVFLQTPELMQSPGICLSKPFSLPVLRTTIEIALSLQ